MPLTKEQQYIYDELINFINSNEKEIILNSAGGTSKTYTIIELLKFILNTKKINKIAISTPTHTSLEVIKTNILNSEIKIEKLEIVTIQKLLCYRPALNYHGIKVFKRNEMIKFNLDKYDLIIIDECSMLTDEIVDDLENLILNNKTKIIYLGDSSQINPVNHEISKIFNKNIKLLLLLKIVRTNNKLLKKFIMEYRLYETENKIPNIKKPALDFL